VSNDVYVIIYLLIYFLWYNAIYNTMLSWFYYQAEDEDDIIFDLSQLELNNTERMLSKQEFNKQLNTGSSKYFTIKVHAWFIIPNNYRFEIPNIHATDGLYIWNIIAL